MGAELVLRVNVYGLRHLTERLLATGTIADGGSIVNIASLAGMAWQRHLDRIAALDAAADFDAGIDVAKALRRAAARPPTCCPRSGSSPTPSGSPGGCCRQRIRVNSVSPGPVLTPLFPYFESRRRRRADGVDERAGRPGRRARRRGGRDRVAARRRQQVGQRRRPARRRRPVGRDARRLGRHQGVAGVGRRRRPEGLRRPARRRARPAPASRRRADRRDDRHRGVIAPGVGERIVDLRPQLELEALQGAVPSGPSSVTVPSLVTITAMAATRCWPIGGTTAQPGYGRRRGGGER